MLCYISCSLGEYTADYWFENAKEYYNKGSYDISLLAVNKSLDIDPSNINAWMLKGDAFYASGMYKSALDAYSKAVDLDASSTVALNNPVDAW